MELVEKLLDQHLQKGHINLPTILLTVMHAVEQMSQDKEMHSGDKLKTALTLLPEAIDHSVEKGWITPEQRKQIQDTIKSMGPVLKQFISAICWVTTNPEFVQLEQQVKAKCLAFCHKHGRGTA